VPEFAEAHYNLGVVWEDLNHLEEAFQEWRRAIELDTDAETTAISQAAIENYITDKRQVF
jgi:tetratricopeptide (TPR) repeat protein